MTMQLYSENGLVDQISTNAGWGELQQALQPIFGMGGYQTLKAFLNAGETEDPKQLLKEINMLTKSIHNVPQKPLNTLTNLAKLLQQCKEIAVVQ